MKKDTRIITEFCNKNSFTSKYISENMDNFTIFYNDEEKLAKIKTNSEFMFKMYEDFFNNSHLVSEDYKYKSNCFTQFFNQNYDKFAGGSHKEILDSSKGLFDQKAFLESRNNISKIIKNLDFLEQEISMKRIRKTSEFDGELDFDRIWDREMFHSTERQNKGIERTMDIFVHMSFHAGISSESINQYGTMIWAIIDLLESNGIQCSVNLTTKVFCGEAARYPNGLPISHDEYEIEVKKKGQYVETMELAKCFNSNFYRRVYFNTKILAWELLGTNYDEGLGSPCSIAPTSEKGKMHFAIDQVNLFKNDFTALNDFIRKAL